MWLMWFVSQCLFLVEEFCWHARKPLWIQVKGIHHFKTSTFMHQSAEREFWMQFFNPLKFTISRSQDFTFGHPTCFHLFSLVHKIASLKGVGCNFCPDIWENDNAARVRRMKYQAYIQQRRDNVPGEVKNTGKKWRKRETWLHKDYLQIQTACNTAIPLCESNYTLYKPLRGFFFPNSSQKKKKNSFAHILKVLLDNNKTGSALNHLPPSHKLLLRLCQQQ